MQMQFAAAQTVQLTVPEQPIPIEHYLRQPQRLVHALTDPTRVQSLGEGQFRLKMRPLRFLAFNLQPTVDLHVWSDAKGVTRLQSIGSQIHGIEYINQRFSLSLTGILQPSRNGHRTYLKGEAKLRVAVDVPPPLRLTPLPLLEATGNSLLKSVLLTIKQRLMHQLLSDYQHWVTAETALSQRGSYDLPLGKVKLGPTSLPVQAG
ncbi:DUF1997 domain-containing protein [Trichothermofontia sp.]